MSIKIMSRVWEQSKQGGSQLLLLLAIADNANDSGYAWPGQEYLAKKIRMNRRSIPRLTKKLEDARELFINDRSDKGKSIQYIVTTGMTWADFANSLQAHLKYNDEKCADIYPWFYKGGDDKLSTPEGEGVDIAMSGGDDKLSGGVDIAMSTEPSLTINEPSIFNGSAKNPQTSSSDILEPSALASGICTLCILGETISKDKRQEVKGAAIILHPKNITQADLNNFKAWWYDHTWKGQRNQLPEPKDICNEWGRFEAARVVNVLVTPDGDGGVYI